MADRFPEQAESDWTYWVGQKSVDQNDKTIIFELSYREILWFVSGEQISYNCLSLWFRQIIDLRATDKSWCFLNLVQ